MWKDLGILLLLGVTLAMGEVHQNLGGENDPQSRIKRQTAVPTFPSFGPEVDGTVGADYFQRKDRPAAVYFSQFEDSNAEKPSVQLRSLDGEQPFGETGFPSGSHLSSSSGSVTRKTHSRRTSRKEIKVKSAGSTATTIPADLPSGFGPSTGPKFSEEVTYQRSTNANKRANSRLRSLDTSGSSNCITCSRRIAVSSDEAPGATELRTLTRSSTTKANGHESEGLRLYRKLLSGSGRRNQNQLRSLDQSTIDTPQNGILPYHRQSASWSQKEEKHESRRRTSSSSHGTSTDAPISTELQSSADELNQGYQHQSLDQSTTDAPQNGILPHHRQSASWSQKEEELQSSAEEASQSNYRTSAGRRTSRRNGSRTRALTSSASQTSDSQVTGNGEQTCVQCKTRSSSSSSVTNDSPVTYHRSSRVPSTGDYLIPPAPATAISETWAEREERRHSSSRTVSRTINGVETNGLGEPLVSEEEASYRRAASGGSSSASSSQLRSRAGTLSTADQSDTNSAATHSTSNSEASNTQTVARTLSVAGATTNGNGRSNRRYNCSRISTTSLSEGAQSVTELVTPPPCVLRRSSSASENQLSTRSSSNNLNLPYPPVITFGRGDQEVHARVLESDHENESAFNQQRHSQENHEESSIAQPTQSSYRSKRKHKKAHYRKTVFKNYTTSEYPASLETWLGA